MRYTFLQYNGSYIAIPMTRRNLAVCDSLERNETNLSRRSAATCLSFSIPRICRNLVNPRDKKFPRDVFLVSTVLVKFRTRANLRYTHVYTHIAPKRKIWKLKQKRGGNSLQPVVFTSKYHFFLFRNTRNSKYHNFVTGTTLPQKCIMSFLLYFFVNFTND